MRTFRYFLALFVVVLAVTEVLSLPTPAPPKTPAKKPVAAVAPSKGKGKAVASRPVSPAASRPGSPAGSRPGTPDPAEGGCSKQTTCEKCIAVKGGAGKPVCGFSKAGKCVGITGAPAGLAKTAAECKALAAGNQAEASGDAALLADAKKEFAKIKPHVFGTEKNLKNTAGRHLASSLLSVPANKNNLEKTRVSDAGTGLSVFKTAGNKVKTTFDDDLGLWTAAQVEAVCVEAIKNVLKIKKTTTLPKGNTITSVSVASPRGNLCMSVQGNTSVFPGSIKKTTTAPGQPCTNDSGSTDE